MLRVLIIWYLVSYLAGDTVDLGTERTLEDVDIVIKDCPASAVRGLAVESVLHVGLGFLHRLLLVFLVHSGADQLGEGDYKLISRSLSVYLQL